MKLTTEELRELECAASEPDWNGIVARITNRRGGEYPPDWWGTVVESGVMVRAASVWSTARRIKDFARMLSRRGEILVARDGDTYVVRRRGDYERRRVGAPRGRTYRGFETLVGVWLCDHPRHTVFEDALTEAESAIFRDVVRRWRT